MPLSRQSRIIILLVIDTLFFFVELITGYTVGSLALVADSFHMLNDVLSLVVALYTIKLARSPSSAENSYGWQRAEILGALINGVFLVALCVSIALEALGRFISPPEISSPVVIVIVGTLGLISNIVGLFLFHEHGHSHDHSHGPVHLPDEDEVEDATDELYQHPAQTRAQVIETAHEFGYGRHADESSTHGASSPPSSSHVRAGSRSGRKPTANRSRASRGSITSTVPPVPGSNEVLPPHTHGNGSDDHAGKAHKHNPSPLARTVEQAEEGHDDHDGHDHSNGNGKSAGGGGHGHSHGSMNMRGVFLHVLGDALGNVGVIAAGLVIWFVHKRWALYFDPAISLVITCIILSSAWPLVKSASYILMQGVPSHVSLDAVRDSIRDVPGVVSVHELHVWQLSETTVVASVHVLIEPGADYMEVAGGIRESMHKHGIHSVTIQPEFYSEEDDQSISETACLIRCPPEQCGTDTCCPPTPADGKTPGTTESTDDHAGHSH